MWIGKLVQAFAKQDLTLDQGFLEFFFQHILAQNQASIIRVLYHLAYMIISNADMLKFIIGVIAHPLFKIGFIKHF